jgi:hypothetical protein
MAIPTDYWIVLAQVAGALAGFALTSHSIVASRVANAEANQLCDRYGLRDSTSRRAWPFILYSLLLFVLPLILGLIHLLPMNVTTGSESWPAGPVIALVAALFAIFGLLMVSRQYRYFSIAHRSGDNERDLDNELYRKGLYGEPRQISPESERRIPYLKIALYCSLLFASYLFQLCGAFYLVALGLDFWGGWNPQLEQLRRVAVGVGQSIRVEYIALVSLTFGILFTFWHLQLFDEKNVLLSIDGTSRDTLRRTSLELKKKCEELRKRRQAVLALYGRDSTDPSNKTLIAAKLKRGISLVDFIDRLRKLEPEIRGMSSNPQGTGLEPLLERRHLHICVLDHYARSDDLSDCVEYSSIVQRLRSIELYVAALTKYERQLEVIEKEIRQHLISND